MREPVTTASGVRPLLGGREFVVDLAPWRTALTRAREDGGAVHRVGLAVADWCSMLWHDARSSAEPTHTDLVIGRDEFVEAFAVKAWQLVRAIQVLANADCVVKRYSPSDQRITLQVRRAWIAVPARAALPVRRLAAFCRDARTAALPMIAVLRTIADVQVHQLPMDAVGDGVAISIATFFERTGIRKEQLQWTLRDAVTLGLVECRVTGHRNRTAQWTLTPRAFQGMGVVPAVTEVGAAPPAPPIPHASRPPTARVPQAPVGRLRPPDSSAATLGTIYLPNGVVFTPAADAASDQIAALLQQLAALPGTPDPA